jgi:hypothetical protein
MKDQGTGTLICRGCESTTTDEIFKDGDECPTCGDILQELRDVENTYVDQEREPIEVEYDYVLDDDELIEIGSEIAELDNNINEYELEKKRVNAELGGKIKVLQTEMKQKCAIIRDKKETRVAQCVPTPDYEEGVMRFVSIDTGEMIKERPLTNEERQMSLMDIKEEGIVDEEATEAEVNEALIDEAPPRCHMKEMELVQDGDEAYYKCTVCGATK